MSEIRNGAYEIYDTIIKEDNHFIVTKSNNVPKRKIPYDVEIRIMYYVLVVKSVLYSKRQVLMTLRLINC